MRWLYFCWLFIILILFRLSKFNCTSIIYQTLEKEVEQGDEQLNTQLKIFLDHKEEDYYELIQRFDNVRLEVDDVNDCFEVVKNLIMDTPAEPYLLSILQHLLFVRDDAVIR